MENASKAIIMAGSVLISLLIIGALMLMFSNLGKIKETEASAEDISKLQKYDNLIEGYCKPGLYGSELVSLANLIEDYNKRLGDLKGYIPVKLEVYTKEISLAKYFEKNYNNHLNLINDFNEIETEINTLKREVICGESIEKISGMITLAIQNLVDNYYKNYDENKKEIEVNKIQAKVDQYLKTKSEYTTFKNKRFNSPEIEQYNGKITKLVFKEIGL